MEVNKEQSEKCRDLGALALRQGDFAKAIKFLEKSLQLYPLPGVDALLAHAKTSSLKQNSSSSSNSDSGTNNSNGKRETSSGGRQNTTTSNNNGTSNDSTNRRSSSTSSSSGTTQQQQQNGGNSDGRAYTPDMVAIVRKVLQSKEGGRGAHYRVLDISTTATENDIKKAYRKLSLKVHPDKNSAPHSAEAFKAVGLAYATLSDTQKRTIYDRYGDEDPDNHGGGSSGMASHMRRRGGGPQQEMSPEDIFNAFFGGGMPGGVNMGGGGGGMPGGVHFYSSGFGPGGGIHFRSGGGGGQGRRPRTPGQQPQQQTEQQAGFGMLLQMLPILIFLLLSFLSANDQSASSDVSKGEGQYFSLESKTPFTNPMSTRLTKVKEIPYFVTDKFLRIVNRDRYQLSQVEHLVERAYENYLIRECKVQKEYKNGLFKKAEQKQYTDDERQRLLKFATEFELSRCDELMDLFPSKPKQKQQRR